MLSGSQILMEQPGRFRRRARSRGVGASKSPATYNSRIDEYDYLDENTTAKTTTFREFEGTIIDWSWFFHKKTGKIPFLIRKDIMASDEAIVAVIGHEMFELEMLRSIFAEGAPVEKWEAETSPNNPGNFHWQAWDYADDLVARMREEDG